MADSGIGNDDGVAIASCGSSVATGVSVVVGVSEESGGAVGALEPFPTGSSVGVAVVESIGVAVVESIGVAVLETAPASSIAVAETPHDMMRATVPIRAQRFLARPSDIRRMVTSSPSRQAETHRALQPASTDLVCLQHISGWLPPAGVSMRSLGM